MTEVKKFITKDSGKRQEYQSGMRRDLQDNKPDLYLWMPKDIPYEEQFLTRAGYAARRGANKYGDRNFEKANSTEELERFKSSALRHMFQWLNNETDEDHAVAIFFNLLSAEMVKYKLRVKNGDKRKDDETTSNKNGTGTETATSRRI
jgi:hypothetical protein